MHTWVCGVFGENFEVKKCPAQLVFGFGVLEPRPHWAQIGGCSDTLSRLKGIETQSDSCALRRIEIKFRYAFPFEGN